MDSIKIGDKEILLSKHASHRATKRKITLDEIKEAILNARRKIKTSKDNEPDSISFYGRNEVVVVTNLMVTRIITVIKRNKKYSLSKIKERRNKKRLIAKRRYGNRAKK